MKMKCLLGLVCAVMAAWADPVVRTVESKDGKEPANYIPAMLSNGRLNVFMDYRLSVATKGMKGVAGFTPGIYWEGRRSVDNDGKAAAAPYSHNMFALFSQGSFRTRLVVDGKEQQAPKRWSQSLDLHRALTTVENEFDGGVRLTGEAFVSKPRNIIAVRQTVANTSDKPRKVAVGLVYTAPKHERMVGEWKRENGAAVWSMTCYGRFVTHETITVRSAMGGTRSCASAPGEKCDNSVRVEADAQERVPPKVNADDGAVQQTVTLAPGEKQTAEWFVVFNDDLAAKLPKVSPLPAPPTPLTTYAALRDEHVADWAAYYAESEVKVPDERIQSLFEMARYHMRCCATEWSIPVGIIASHWHGRIFAFDEMYGAQGLVAAGHFATAKVVPDYRSATLRKACVRCNNNMGKPFGKFGARWVWEAVEGNDIDASPLGFWQDHIFQQATVAQSVWTYYRYTGDRDYLAKQGYDVLRECALFYRKLKVADLADGTSFVVSCTDLERLGSGHERAFMTTCGAIMSMRVAAEAADVLGRDAELAKDFRACADRLVASLPERDGRYIAYPGCKENSMGTLAGFFPFRTFDRSNEKQVKAVKHFLANGQSVGNMYATGKKICPWYAATMAVASLRAGIEGEPPMRWLQEADRSSGCWGEYWEINEPGAAQMHPWFMTAAGNVLYAICQLLVADQEGEVQLAAGVPDDWKDYSFRLPAPGGHTVTLEVKDGKLVQCAAAPRRHELPKPKFTFKGKDLKL